ncbi:hypothetical protein JG687_00011233 [Phytophthora cactorum]|uniref:Phytotoxin PcF domain-containing protein n=1 Tax=Phytophthora cactorum TaxID=29920 RepID=A0A8T1U8Z7_9STRA|nr:hypothetical protein JG687_00011233 [Phytophthora cactorum]
MSVALVSEYDTERVVETVAVIGRASENPLSAEACLRIDFANTNCDDPEHVRALRATNRWSWNKSLVSREIVYENFSLKTGNSNSSEPSAAEGCALITSPHNGIISECSSRQEGDFYACCRQSCNTGNPCKVE